MSCKGGDDSTAYRTAEGLVDVKGVVSKQHISG